MYPLDILTGPRVPSATVSKCRVSRGQVWGDDGDHVWASDPSWMRVFSPPPSSSLPPFLSLPLPHSPLSHPPSHSPLTIQKVYVCCPPAPWSPLFRIKTPGPERAAQVAPLPAWPSPPLTWVIPDSPFSGSTLGSGARPPVRSKGWTVLLAIRSLPARCPPPHRPPGCPWTGQVPQHCSFLALECEIIG